MFVPDRDVVTGEWRTLLNNKLRDYIIDVITICNFHLKSFDIAKCNVKDRRVCCDSMQYYIYDNIGSATMDNVFESR